MSGEEGSSEGGREERKRRVGSGSWRSNIDRTGGGE